MVKTATRILFTLACIFRGSAASWYVDIYATGTRDGTSWANAWTNLNAVAGVSAGDTVYISGGTTSKTYPAQPTYWLPTGGSVASRITYKVGQDAGHSGTVIFDGGGANWWLGGIKHVNISGNFGGSTNMVVTNFVNLAVYGDNSYGVTLDHIIAYGAFRFQTSTNIELSFIYAKPPNNNDFVVSFNTYSDGVRSYTNNLIHNCTLLGPRDNSPPGNSGFGADIVQGGRCTSLFSNLFGVYLVDSFTEGQHMDGWQTDETSHWVQIFDNVYENIPNYCIFWNFLTPMNTSNLLVFNNIFRHTLDVTNANGLTVGVSIFPFGSAGSGNVYSNLVVANNTFVDFFGRQAIAWGLLTTTNTYQSCRIQNNLIVNSGHANTNQYNAVSFWNSSASISKYEMSGMVISHNKLVAGARGTTSIDAGTFTTSLTSFPVRFADYVELAPKNLHILDAVPGANLSHLFNMDKDGNARVAQSDWSVGAYIPTKVSPPASLLINP